MIHLLNAYEFTFAGESSFMYHLMIYDLGGDTQEDVSLGNVGSIIETRINRRVSPIHFGVKYHDSPLEFQLLFGSMEPLDRYEIENIALWLTGHQDYQWLTIDQPDLDHANYRCLITELTPISVGWLPYAFRATIRCDTPYAYGFPFEYDVAVSGTTKLLIKNDGSAREYVKPDLLFEASAGTKELSIVNHDDGDREFKISQLPGSAVKIKVDNINGIIQETSSDLNVYGGFNMNFFRLVLGDNNLTIKGNGTLHISGRFLYNVGA